MTDENRDSGTEKSDVQNRAAKKPYEKPEFRYERVFETMALSCGKIITQSQCHFSTKRS